ncbi:Secreted protein OS=Streptomyces aurantiogriseus OX=66870 GN=GCM10010251_29100 PE=4 SV=1 [Streptomyces aurantiogriseus]|uniref:Uncharacterized protein n=1 Tax=Streptomyces aurantiogriseus TaxID=66870 RepID=A0A918C802_9ACTN|nr:hypothetical protein GCM10010251_29100 [Streptomyces aurantiogriseus]
MLWVAILLLPILSVLLVVMDRVEDRLSAPAPAGPRHAAHKRHLRLVRGTAESGEPAADKGRSEPRAA